MMKHLLFFALSIALFSCKTSSNLEVSGRQLMLNGSPYLIKGVCYHPVPKGSSKSDFSSLDKDLALMLEAGINTIRVYEPIVEKDVLDKIQASGIKIIMGFGYNQKGQFDLLSGTYLDYIKKYKNHEAILFWELGNEYNYHPEWFSGDITNWYTTLTQAIDEIHQIDPTHLVATAHGDMPDSLAYASVPNLDIWGMNVYRWDQPKSVFKEWELLSTKPMYLSESGADSYMTKSFENFRIGENQEAQAVADSIILNQILENQAICSGTTLFSFSDEWWKAGSKDTQEPGGWAPNSNGVPYDGSPNEEYWGIVDINRNKKKAYYTVKEIYTLTKNQK